MGMRAVFKFLLSAAVLLSSTHVWAADQDGDGIDDSVDNCISVRNHGQYDGDGNGVGNACEPAHLQSGVPVNDYNGDGLGDALLLTSDALNNAMANTNKVVLRTITYNNLVPSYTESILTGLDFPKQLEGHGDFNGDGVQDILYTINDDLYVALIDDGVIYSHVNLDIAVPIDHQIVTGDFDGDLDADILIRDRVLGNMQTITMQAGAKVTSHTLPNMQVKVTGIFTDQTNSDKWILGQPISHLSANTARQYQIPFIRKGNTNTFLFVMTLSPDLSNYTVGYASGSYRAGSYTPIQSLNLRGDGKAVLIMRNDSNGKYVQWNTSGNNAGAKIDSVDKDVYESFTNTIIRADTGHSSVSYYGPYPMNFQGRSFLATFPSATSPTGFQDDLVRTNSDNTISRIKVADSLDTSTHVWRELSECNQPNRCKIRSANYFGYFFTGSLCNSYDPTGAACIQETKDYTNIAYVKAMVPWDENHSVETLAGIFNAQLEVLKQNNQYAILDVMPVVFAPHSSTTLYANEKLLSDYQARWQLFINLVYSQYSEQIIAVVPRDEPYTAPGFDEAPGYQPAKNSNPERIIAISNTLRDFGHTVHHTNVTVPFDSALKPATQLKVAVNDMGSAYLSLSAWVTALQHYIDPNDPDKYYSDIYPAEVDWISAHSYQYIFSSGIRSTLENMVPRKWPNQHFWLVPTAFSEDGSVADRCLWYATPSTTVIGNSLLAPYNDYDWALNNDVAAIVPFLYNHAYCTTPPKTVHNIINRRYPSIDPNTDPMVQNLVKMGMYVTHKTPPPSQIIFP